MNCFACERNLTACIDDELTPEVRREVEAHLDACDRCREDYETQLATWEAAGNLRSEPAPDGLWRAVESELQPQGGSPTTEDLALIIRGLAGEIRDLKQAVEALRQDLQPEPEAEDIRTRSGQSLDLWTGPGVGRTRSEMG